MPEKQLHPRRVICLAKSADVPEDLPTMDSEAALAYAGALAKSIQSIRETTPT